MLDMLKALLKDPRFWGLVIGLLAAALGLPDDLTIDVVVDAVIVIVTVLLAWLGVDAVQGVRARLR